MIIVQLRNNSTLLVLCCVANQIICIVFRLNYPSSQCIVNTPLSITNKCLTIDGNGLDVVFISAIVFYLLIVYFCFCLADIFNYKIYPSAYSKGNIPNSIYTSYTKLFFSVLFEVKSSICLKSSTRISNIVLTYC